MNIRSTDLSPIKVDGRTGLRKSVTLVRTASPLLSNEKGATGSPKSVGKSLKTPTKRSLKALDSLELEPGTQLKSLNKQTEEVAVTAFND